MIPSEYKGPSNEVGRFCLATARQGRTVKQEHEEISHNQIQASVGPV